MGEAIRRRTLLAGAAGTIAAVVTIGEAAPASANAGLGGQHPGHSRRPGRRDVSTTPLTVRNGTSMQSVKGPAMSDSNFDAVTTAAALDIFRFPGGTTANYWDWQKGWVLDDADLPASGQQFAGQNPTPWLLEDLAAYCTSTGVTPVFVVNIATSDLQYQLDMLSHAASLGLPISYVELGNEFFWAGQADLFASVADYAAKASDWADAIKTAYPDAEIATVAWDGNSLYPAGPRPAGWNAGMSATLAANSNITAVTMHPYLIMKPLQTTYSEFMDPSDPDDQQRLMAFGFKAHADTVATMDSDIPSGKKLWVTEYNFIDPNHLMFARWLHGMFVATQTLTMLDESRTAMALQCGLSGPPNFALYQHPVYVPVFANEFGVTPTAWAITAQGVTMSEIYAAREGATGYEVLELPESTTLSIEIAGGTHTYPSLYGMRFTHPGGAATGVVLNVSDTAVTVDLTSGCPVSAGNWTQHWAAPDLLVVDGDTDVSSSSGTVSSAVTLNPFSITVLY